MAQHDYNIINGTGAAVREDINKALAAIASNNAGPVAPSTALPGTLWFDISDTAGPGVLKVLGNDAKWHRVEAGAIYVPVAGGNIVGDLTVTGVFSNPDFNNKRRNYMSDTAPTSPVQGQLWYDTNVEPDSLKVWTGSAWVELVDVTSPTFTQMITIDGAAYAIVNLIAPSGTGAETRRIYNHPTEDWLVFDKTAPAPSGNMMFIDDTGDWWIRSLSGGSGNWIGATLLNKQKNLNFTPIQQYDGNKIHIGYSPAQLWVNGVSRGNIRVGVNTPLYGRADIGAYWHMTSIDPVIAKNQVAPAGWLRFGYDDSNIRPASGSFRNMGGQIGDTQMSIFQRVA